MGLTQPLSADALFLLFFSPETVHVGGWTCYARHLQESEEAIWVCVKQLLECECAISSVNDGVDPLLVEYRAVSDDMIRVPHGGTAFTSEGV